MKVSKVPYNNVYNSEISRKLLEIIIGVDS